MNQLFYGDNLDILCNKIKDDSVDLCYIDPPFNSKRNYFQIYNNLGKEDAAQAQAFIDTWTWNELAELGLREITQTNQGYYTRQTIELIKGLKPVLGAGSLFAYLINMTQCVNEIQRVLKATGSFYLHCDPTCSHYLKLVLDSVFCGGGRNGDFQNEIIWSYHRWTGTTSHFQRMHDIVFFYTKDKKDFVFNVQYEAYSDKSKHKAKRVSTAAKGKVIAQQYTNDTSRQKAMRDVWEISYLNSQAKERLHYPTQKPEALLERVIQASSNEGDVVLDAYCGCGTTVAVAQRFNRQWIGIDITYQSIAVILKRLEESFGADILNQITLGGIPRDMESARALANKKDDRLRKEFEKWAVLTYTNHRAVINDKKGIDGIVYIVTGKDKEDSARVVLQVKSGKVKRNDIATLNSDRLREQAAMAIFITLEEPTKPMRDEALASGVYHYELLNRDYPCIQIVTIQEMMDGVARFELPMTRDVLKTAPAVNTSEQYDLGVE
ncbi:restriction endonuclease [Rhodoferax sp. 4810]|uniref:Methyltransferase n=1 Tax=Thiospirillum jenense TaxID=1653858 RepID=A0A839HAC1_9GAMM|nr:DNA methyltransferase [Thiospirillum jenense]MBB1074216.1 restriction endonuclease [Rhodoferax jenense]MBB1125290.1 restriction endonuclease [Thiospirillum jenense]